MMLSTPTGASAQHAQHGQHAQLPRAVRSTFGLSSSGNGGRRWQRWHPVWMALATKKVLRHCEKKRQWVAPTISANLGGEEIQMALGAVEQQQSNGTGCGRVLYGQIFRGGKWCPVKLTEKEPDLWLGLEAGPLTLSFDTMKRSLLREAPGWPSELAEDLSRWPLKGPGTVVFDAHFFVQRGVSAVLSSGSPVLFVGAAQQLGLVTEDWIPGIAKQLKNRSLCEVVGSSSSLEEMIQDLPEDLRKGHFDIAGAIAGVDERHWTQVYTVKIERPEQLIIESCSWTLGAMLREPISEVNAAVGDVLLKINGQGILWHSFDEIQELLVQLGSAEITFGRPKVIQKIYLREAVASAEALSLFGVDGLDGLNVDGKVLVSQLGTLLSRAGLVFAEDRPGLFAGDAGTASHLHVDRKPLLQFCHGLHGCKFFCVAPGKSPGPQVPWQSGSQLEMLDAQLPTDEKLSPAAVEWMQSPEVSVCCLHPGDLLLFLGQSCHAGCNGAAQMSLSLFHGAMPLSYMLQGAFGVPYQLMARKLMS